MNMSGFSTGIANRVRTFLGVVRGLMSVLVPFIKRQSPSTLGAAGVVSFFVLFVLGLSMFGSSEPGAAPTILRIHPGEPVRTAVPGLGTSLIATNGSVISDPALIEISEDGPLPIVSREGRKAMHVYARPFDAADPRPKIALIVSGLGLSAMSTQAAVDQLAPGITFAFTPYGASLQGVVSTARANGHEVLIEVPLEPYDYPDNDPGQNTLLTGAASGDNPGRLKWVMSRFTGYAGLINSQGSKFLASAPDIKAMMQDLTQRGLYFVDSGESDRSLARDAALGVGAAFARGDTLVDQMPTANAIATELARLETLAQQRGYAIGIASALPVTLLKVDAWARALEQKGIALVPVSALLVTHRAPPKPKAPSPSAGTPHAPRRVAAEPAAEPAPGPHP